jgi:hypothetical protein
VQDGESFFWGKTNSATYAASAPNAGAVHDDDDDDGDTVLIHTARIGGSQQLPMHTSFVANGDKLVRNAMVEGDGAPMMAVWAHPTADEEYQYELCVALGISALLEYDACYADFTPRPTWASGELERGQLTTVPIPPSERSKWARPCTTCGHLNWRERRCRVCGSDTILVVPPTVAAAAVASERPSDPPPRPSRPSV